MHATTQHESFAHTVFITAAVDTMLTHLFFVLTRDKEWSGEEKSGKEDHVARHSHEMLAIVSLDAESDVDQMALTLHDARAH